MTLRVAVADDQELVRAGLCGILGAASDLAVVGEAATGGQAIALVQAEKPDVVLMDIRMPELDGIEATRRITATEETKVLILTTFDLDEYVYSALRGGASGFLLKDTPPRQLIEAVRTVAHGDALLAPRHHQAAHCAVHRPAARRRRPRTTRGPHRPRARSPHPCRRRPDQRRDRPPPVHQPRHRQNPRQAPTHQAGRPRPSATGHHRPPHRTDRLWNLVRGTGLQRPTTSAAAPVAAGCRGRPRRHRRPAGR
jgi:DNA-binding NarL/FixJ family response regulator